jgi:hypothetical protein
LLAALSEAAAAVAAEPKQERLSLALREEPPRPAAEPKPEPTFVPPAPAAATNPAAELLESVRGILRRELSEPRSEAEVAELLAVSKPQVKAWLTKLVEDGALEKISKPIRYRAATTVGRLL